MPCTNHSPDVSTNIEIGGDIHFPGVEKFNEVIHDPVGHVFVKDALVAKSVDVKLEALEFHAPISGLVGDQNLRKVGEPRLRTHASELRALEINCVAAVLGSIGEALELRVSNHFRAVWALVSECHRCGWGALLLSFHKLRVVLPRDEAKAK